MFVMCKNLKSILFTTSRMSLGGLRILLIIGLIPRLPNSASKIPLSLLYLTHSRRKCLTVSFVSLSLREVYFYTALLSLTEKLWIPLLWTAETEKKFYLTTHSTHFIYGYMASDIWLRTILIVGKHPRCRHIGYSYRLTARVLLYAPSHRQDNTYHGLCYTSRGALAGTRNSSMGPPHEGSIRRPIAP